MQVPDVEYTGSSGGPAVVNVQRQIGKQPAGLRTSEIKQLRVISLSQANARTLGQGECSVCMESFDHVETCVLLAHHQYPLVRNDLLVELPCSDTHIFHARCLLPWLQQCKDCPLCRADISKLLKNQSHQALHRTPRKAPDASPRPPAHPPSHPPSSYPQPSPRSPRPPLAHVPTTPNSPPLHPRFEELDLRPHRISRLPSSPHAEVIHSSQPRTPPRTPRSARFIENHRPIAAPSATPYLHAETSFTTTTTNNNNNNNSNNSSNNSSSNSSNNNSSSNSSNNNSSSNNSSNNSRSNNNSSSNRGNSSWVEWRMPAISSARRSVLSEHPLPPSAENSLPQLNSAHRAQNDRSICPDLQSPQHHQEYRFQSQDDPGNDFGDDLHGRAAPVVSGSEAPVSSGFIPLRSIGFRYSKTIQDILRGQARWHHTNRTSAAAEQIPLSRRDHTNSHRNDDPASFWGEGEDRVLNTDFTLESGRLDLTQQATRATSPPPLMETNSLSNLRLFTQTHLPGVEDMPRERIGQLRQIAERLGIRGNATTRHRPLVPPINTTTTNHGSSTERPSSRGRRVRDRQDVPVDPPMSAWLGMENQRSAPSNAWAQPC